MKRLKTKRRSERPLWETKLFKFCMVIKKKMIDVLSLKKLLSTISTYFLSEQTAPLGRPVFRNRLIFYFEVST